VIFFKSLKLSGFRNFEDEIIHFQPRTNIILGENGQGKSNLLEALFLLCTGKSFRTSHLKELIGFDKAGFYLEALLEKEGIDHSVNIEFYPHKKKLTIDQSHYPHLHPLMGFIPVVIMTPEMKKIIDGGPLERRKFIDFLASQLSRPYFEAITRYHKALKQRNAALKSNASTSVWEQLMAKEWLVIEQQRAQTILKLEQSAKRHLEAHSNLKASIKLEYEPSFSGQLSYQAILQMYQKQRSHDLHTGSTSYGPHKDELKIILNEQLAEISASEGQKKMVIAALCLASADLIKEILGITPLFLIDDYDAHFDLIRKGWIYDELKNQTQSFLTSPIFELAHQQESLVISQGKLLSPAVSKDF
jgi:DNA replication and repair protein RecF